METEANMNNMTSNGEKFAGKRKFSDKDDEMTEDDDIVYINFTIRGQLKMINGDQIDAAKHQTGGGGAAGGN
ncbi:hypothetical protein TSUD_68330 [Trifolium subterraneum]|uniref:Uncharacterized protein n=1 Tax=Trifolium subterraneum TaxID=3900 RepID=A0A2Z6N5X7_TRISU|nr:hypothetical protein TSUD_68330 [Trifolium subterraneum]